MFQQPLCLRLQECYESDVHTKRLRTSLLQKYKIVRNGLFKNIFAIVESIHMSCNDPCYKVQETS